MKKAISTVLKSVFSKFLISYIILLLIPTAVILVFVNNAVLPAMTNDKIKYDLATLARVQLITDTNLAQLEIMRQQIGLDKALLVEHMIEDVELSRSTINELKRYSITNPFLHEIAVYFHGDSFVYTSSSTYTLDNFINKAVQYETWTPSQFWAQIQDTDGTYMRSAENAKISGSRKNIITVMNKMRVPDYQEPVTVMFFLNNSFLQNVMSANGAGENTQYIILDSQNKILSSLGDEELLKSVSDDILTHKRGSFTVDFNGEEMLMCIVSSSNLGLKYLSFTPLDKAYAMISNLKLELLIIMFSLMLVGFIIIYFNMRTNYRPIRRLSEYAKALLPQTPIQDNELSAIRSSMEYLSAVYHNLCEDTKISQKIHTLQKVLQGEYSQASQIDEAGRNLGFCFDKENFSVLTIMFTKSFNLDNLLSIEKCINKSLSGYLQMGNSYDKHLFVANFGDEEKAQYDARLAQIHLDLKHIFPESALVLSSGGIYQNINEIPISYKESVVAADYRFVQGNDCVITQQNLKGDNNFVYSYPHALFERLHYSLIKGETENFYPALGDIIEFIKTSGCPLFYARSLSYEIINILSTVLKELGDETFSAKLMAEYSVVLSEFTTIDDLTNSLKSISLNICYYVVEDILNSERELVTKIKAYVQTHYKDADFSVQSLAEKYGMTQVTISQYFKTQTGSTVIDYITNVRMDHAKNLLLTSDSPLDKIVEEIGYLNTSSFIRRFKQLYGLTPRQYAEKNREK